MLKGQLQNPYDTCDKTYTLRSLFEWYFWGFCLQLFQYVSASISRFILTMLRQCFLVLKISRIFSVLLISVHFQHGVYFLYSCTVFINPSKHGNILIINPSSNPFNLLILIIFIGYFNMFIAAIVRLNTVLDSRNIQIHSNFQFQVW